MPGEGLRLTDAESKEMRVHIVEMMGRSALVEYRPYGFGGDRA